MSDPLRPPPDQAAWLDWVLRLWLLTFLVGLVVAAGLTKGLQGAFIGAGPVILKAQLLGSHASQFASLLGLLLLVYLGVLTTRAARNLAWGVLAALLGTIPAVVLYHASRTALPSTVEAVAALATAVVVTICAARSEAPALLRWAAASGSLGLLCKVVGYLLLEQGASASAMRAAEGLSAVGTWGSVACVFLSFVTGRRRPLSAACALGLSFIPAASANTLSNASELSFAVATLGHTSAALVGTEASFAQCYGFTLALILTCLSLVSRHCSISLVAVSLLALCVFLPVTPASCAAITLAAYVLLVLPAKTLLSS